MKSMRTVCVLLAALLAVVPSGRARSTQTHPTTQLGPVNQLQNPSLEEGSQTAGPSGWTATGTTAWESGTAHTGTHSLSITGGGGSWVSAPVASGPAGAYGLVSAWILVPGQGNGITTTSDISVKFIDAKATVIANDSTGNVAGNCSSSYYTWAGAWCYQTRVYPVPDGAVSTTVTLETGQQGSEKWYYDDIFFGQVTSGAEGFGPVEHRPAAPPLPGSAGVSVDAGKVIRNLPTILGGDNAQYKNSALGAAYNDSVVTKTIHDVSHPGVLRFPGGNLVPTYDWEHPSTGGTNPAAVIDVDELMQYVRATGTGDVLWSLNFSGTANAFTVSYGGIAMNAMLNVTSTNLTVKLTGQLDGSADLDVPFSSYPTIGAVVDRINRATGYSAAMVSGEEDRRRDPVSDELVHQSNVAINVSGVTVAVDVGNVHKALRLEEYANNPSSTLIGPNNVTRNKWEFDHDQTVGPYNIRYFEVGNETYLYGPTAPVEETPLDPIGNASKVAAFARGLHGQNAKVKVGIPHVSFLSSNEICCGSGGAQFRFNQVVDRIAGPYVDFVVDHPYEQFHTTYDGELEWPQHLQRIHIVGWHQDEFAQYSPDHRSNIPVFFSEFNLMPYTFASSAAATNPIYQFVNGLAQADTIGVLMTEGAGEASYWDQLDNPYGSHVVYGAAPTQIAVEASGYALGMFNRHFGSILVRDQYASPTYDNPAPDGTRASIDPGGSGLRYPWQSSYASLSADRTHMYIMIINKSGTDSLVPSDHDMPLNTTINISAFVPDPVADVWTLNGTGRGAYNVTSSIAPGQQFVPGAYGMSHSTISNSAPSFSFTTPAHSVTVIELTGSTQRRPK